MSILRIVLLLFLTQSTTPPQTASIQGIVTKPGTNEPLAKASIELQSMDARAAVVTTTADDGRFVFRNIQPGPYRLVATRQGFAATAYGQRVRTAPGATITVSSGQQLTGIRMEMQPTGAFQGRIYDPAGKPVVYATVQAVRPTYRDGRRTLTVAQTTITNDRGEYRLFWLAPGQYFVSAVPPGTNLPTGWARPAPPPYSGSRITYNAWGSASLLRNSTLTPISQTRLTIAPPTYFPGVIAHQAARPIQIQAGSEARGIDFSIAGSATGRKVRGVILGNAGQRVELQLSQVPSLTNFNLVAVNSDTGTFEIGEMIPGSYMLVASANGMTGWTRVDLGDSDMDNVTIRLTPGVDLPGRVVFEGQAAAGARVSIRPEPMIPSLEQDSGVDANGAFVLKQVPPGDYQVTVSPLPDNAYVKSIQFGMTVALNGMLRIRPPQTPLEIVIGDKAGELEGRVTGNPNATVALVPEAGQRHRSELYKTTFTDESGSFRVSGIVPGEYKVFAWQDVEPGAWQDADFIRGFEERGVTVRIQEGATARVALPVIP